MLHRPSSCHFSSLRSRGKYRERLGENIQRQHPLITNRNKIIFQNFPTPRCHDVQILNLVPTPQCANSANCILHVTCTFQATCFSIVQIVRKTSTVYTCDYNKFSTSLVITWNFLMELFHTCVHTAFFITT